MSPEVAPGSINPASSSLRTSFGEVGQRQILNPGLISKVLEPYVGYVATPQTLNWQMGNGPQEFKLVWDGHPGQAYSLQSLSQSIHTSAVKKWGKLEFDKIKVEKLRNALVGLLRVAEKLHGAGWALGFCHPENIFVKENGEVFLANLGFVFENAPSPQFAPTWMNPKSPHAFYWQGDSAEVRQSRPGKQGDGFKEADLRLLGRVIRSSFTGKFAPPLPRDTGIEELSKFLGVAEKAEHGGVGIDDLLRALHGETPASKTTPTFSNPVEKPEGYKNALVGLLGVCVIVIGIIAWKMWPTPQGPIINGDPSPPNGKSTVGPVNDPELKRLYDAAMNATTEERPNKFNALLGYSKESPEKMKYSCEVRLLIGNEILADLDLLDKEVQEDPLKTYPVADKIEKTILPRLSNLAQMGGKYSDEKVSLFEDSTKEFAQRRIAEYRIE